MRDEDIDNILKRAAEAGPDVDPALLDRISMSIGSRAQPVEELPANWILAGGLILICAAVALAGGMLLGLGGVHKMGATQIVLVFGALGLFVALCATACVAEAVPASRRLVSPGLLTISGAVLLGVIFALVFPDYHMEEFLRQGVKCLAAGLGYAVPAAGLTWLLLRRGYAVNPAAAGLARGTLAGLAGVTMLELHCPNFEAPHVVVWHLAVLAISAAVGAWMGDRSG